MPSTTTQWPVSTTINATSPAHFHGVSYNTTTPTSDFIPNMSSTHRPSTHGRVREHNSPYNKEYLYVVLVLTVVEPYLEQLEYYESACAGVFVTRNLVITLGRCVHAAYYGNEVEPHPSFTTVYMQDGVILRSLKIFMRSPSNSDYAIVLVEPSGLTRFPKMPEADLDFDLARDSCLIAGFGGRDRLALANFWARSMRGERVKEVNCRRRDRLCLHFEDLSACQGDQGSPLICDGVLYAIFAPPSLKPPIRCVHRYSAEFAPLYANRHWIDQIVGEHALFWRNSFWYALALIAGVVLTMIVIYKLLAEFVIKPVALRFERHLSEASQILDERELQEQRRASAMSSASSEVNFEGNKADQKQSYLSLYWRR